MCQKVTFDFVSRYQLKRNNAGHGKTNTVAILVSFKGH